jgi:DNA adenine methylase
LTVLHFPGKIPAMINNTKTKLTPPLKWHGGKSYLADWIIDLMPRHIHYVEPYAGGLAVLLNKHPFDERHQWGEEAHERGISEVVNDLNQELTNFWQVLQDEAAFSKLQRIVGAIPFSQIQWEQSGQRMIPRHELDTEAAAAFFVRCRQSRSGGFKVFATLTRNRTRRSMNEQASAWLNCIDGLDDVHERLKRVVVLCGDALKVIRQQDGERSSIWTRHIFTRRVPQLMRTRTKWTRLPTRPCSKRFGNAKDGSCCRDTPTICTIIHSESGIDTTDKSITRSAMPHPNVQ